MYQTVFVIIDGDGNVIGVLPPTDQTQTADLLQQALESHHDAVDSAEVVDLKMEFEGRWTYTAKLELDGDDPREVSLTPAGFFAPQKPKATNFDIRITKDAALELLRTCDLKSGSKCLKDELGIEIMCKEYGDDEDWVGIESDDYYTIRDGEEYQTFEIWLPTIPAQKLLSAIKNIDWRMLRDQKQQLVSIQAYQLSDEQNNAIEGMLNFLDAIQDAAVDDGLAPKDEVFNLHPEPHGQQQISGHSIAWQCDVELDDLNDSEILEISEQLLSLNEGELSAQGREGTIQWWKE